MKRRSRDPQTPATRVTRRVFVQRLALVGGGVVLLGGSCKKDEGRGQPEGPKPVKPQHPTVRADLKTFTAEEFALLGAAVDRLLPKDEDPGALEADVPVYIDRALQQPQLSKMREDFLPGLAALDRRAHRMFKLGFAECSPAQKDELLVVFKNSPRTSGEARWYETLMVLTLEGFLGDPSYGGNKDKRGWKTIGFTLVGGPASEPAPGYNGHAHLCAKRGC